MLLLIIFITLGLHYFHLASTSVSLDNFERTFTEYKAQYVAVFPALTELHVKSCICIAGWAVCIVRLRETWPAPWRTRMCRAWR